MLPDVHVLGPLQGASPEQSERLGVPSFLTQIILNKLIITKFPVHRCSIPAKRMSFGQE
jgi:hypothetical protein